MRNLAREQGRTPVLFRELRRGQPGRTIINAISAGTSATTYTVTSVDWTADGALYYADVVHGKRGVAYIVQLTDDHTGEDIMPERINRRIDLDTVRIWLAYTPASITVIIV